MATGRKGKFVYGAFPDGPLVDRVPSGLGLTSMDTEALSLLEQLIDRGSVGTDYIIVVYIHTPTCMGSQKTCWRARDPFDAGNSGLINISLKMYIIGPISLSCEA